MEPDETPTLHVRAPIDEPAGALQTEVMHAAQDPAADDQAVLLNAPFWVEWLNYGDIVRLGREDESGVRPILEVVVASGHVRVMALTGSHGISSLSDRLHESFPDYALRIEGDGKQALSVSVHPDLDPHEVFSTMADWLDERGAQGDDDVALSPVIETKIGPVDWP